MTKTVIFLSLLFPSLILGGEIYGTIKIGKRPVGEGVKVEIVCGEKTYHGITDQYGSYSIYVQGKGQGTLKVYYPKGKDQILTITIFSYEKNPVRYDLIIVEDPKTSQYILQRR